METNRFRPFRFRSGQLAPNRVVVPPMASQTADADGLATPATIAHYARLARAGAGIVFVEYSFVHASGRGERNQLGADRDAQIPGLAAIARAIHAEGALAGLQLVHVGGKTKQELTGLPLQSPSGIRVPVKGWEPDESIPMTESDIADWRRWFLDAAGRAEAAGFDLVELHAAHGYGLNQWLSPLTNRRADRSRLLLEIAASIRAMYPELLLAARVPGQDHFPGGLTREEMAEIARALEGAGVDLIDVSSGIGGWRRPEGSRGEGYLVADAAFLRRHLTIPVIGVGGIESGEYIDSALARQELDFAAVGRAILADPEAWSRNLQPSPALIQR